jgi:translation initiation factor 1
MNLRNNVSNNTARISLSVDVTQTLLLSIRRLQFSKRPCYNDAVKEPDSILVYSTEFAVAREKKRSERRSATDVAPVKRGTIVRLDRKGRGGKSVTLVEGLQLSNEHKEKLLKQLKSKMGSGGTVKNNALQFQGDHCDAVLAELSGMGISAKRSGG